jgi:hypothetical protein
VRASVIRVSAGFMCMPLGELAAEPDVTVTRSPEELAQKL